jgi:hypothetical protein
MDYQLELARSGEALFKVRSKYQKYIGIPLLRLATSTYDNIS